MLKSLRIQNFALIDHVELSFNSGYTVITGETGSGKSILLGALNLILGERADFSVIGPISDKAVVEADFELGLYHLEEYFTENDLDYSSQTFIRREININGKSRAFINDTPVSLTILKELTSHLVNIHSQYNTLELKSKEYQLDIVDTLANLNVTRNEFSKKYKILIDKRNKLELLKQHLSKSLQQSDYNKFQLEELEILNLDQTNFEQIEIDLKKAENSESIITALNSVAEIIDGDNKVTDQIRTLLSSLDRIKNVDENINNLYERINSVAIELIDISAEANNSIDSFEVNPGKIEALTESMNRFLHVLKKHNLQNQEDLVHFRNNLETDLLDSEETQNQINKQESEWDLLNNELNKEAITLHNEREKAVQSISTELQKSLEELKLPQTKLEFKLSLKDEMNQFGKTDVNILFSANVGIEAIPIEKAASGGELSRVMLALQKMISERKLLPTVLFDEIDTGVSGDVAQKIGLLLQKMGEHFQLIAISHLPQVAAKAQHHMKVEKSILGDRTISKVRILTKNEQVEEIARLMSGEQITDAAIETAKALMN
jgi:DNA repair protein RecN (Recombination protein N)